MFETLNDLKISFLLVILVGILSFANSSILNLPLELRLNGLLVFAVMSPVSIFFLTWIFATAAGIKNKIAVINLVLLLYFFTTVLRTVPNILGT